MHKRLVKIDTKCRQETLGLIRLGEHIDDLADAIGVTREALYLLHEKGPDFAGARDEAAHSGSEIQLSKCKRKRTSAAA